MSIGDLPWTWVLCLQQKKEKKEKQRYTFKHSSNELQLNDSRVIILAYFKESPSCGGLFMACMKEE